MPRKPPPVSLRKPPAAVDLDKAEQFVRKAEAPVNVQTSERLDVETSPPTTAEATTAQRAAKARPAGRKGPAKSVIARSDGRTLRRMTLYLPEELARKLAIYCAREDQEMSAVVSEAVRRQLARVLDE
jgi:hypothetical protein